VGKGGGGGGGVVEVGVGWGSYKRFSVKVASKGKLYGRPLLHEAGMTNANYTATPH
jgi:hypothetical protein